MRGPVQAGQIGALKGTVEVPDRDPVGFREAAVDVSGELLEVLADFPVLRDVAARGRRDLHQHDLAPTLGAPVEEPFERQELLAQALGVVEAVDAQDQLAASHAHARALVLPFRGSALRHLREFPGIYRDRKGLGPNRAAEGADDRVAADLASRFARHVPVEGAQIVGRLETGEVIGEQRANDGFVIGQGEQDLRRRERDMQEKTDGTSGAQPAQLLAHGQQVEVMDPDEVVRPQQSGQMAGEEPVDLYVPPLLATLVCRQIHAVVKQRPQGLVGESVVVLGPFGSRQVEGRIGDLSGRRDLRSARPVPDRFAAPSEPQAPGLPERGFQRDRKPAGAGPRPSGVTRDGDAVGNDDYPAHRTSSQLRLSRIAELIWPTKE